VPLMPEFNDLKQMLKGFLLIVYKWSTEEWLSNGEVQEQEQILQGWSQGWVDSKTFNTIDYSINSSQIDKKQLSKESK